MSLIPDISWFIAFHTHNPSDNRCICYAPSSKARCRAKCNKSDNRRAIELHRLINALPVEDVNTQRIEEYILYLCCKSGRHRDRIRDVGLLTPLAERWLDEMRRCVVEQSRCTTSTASRGVDAILLGDITILAMTTISHAIEANAAPTVNATPTVGALRYQYNISTSQDINTTPPITVASALNSQGLPSKPSIVSHATPPISLEIQPRYHLRSRDARASVAASIRTKTPPKPPQSEFRAHIDKPGPKHSVSSRIRNNLTKQDLKTGSLYIFDRTSSPGHVKIGWTTQAVSTRLGNWAKCGYTPNLIFHVDHIAHAQRVETLTHYELIKEWRRERMCKAEWCRKSHREWFEVSKERAVKVLSNWATLMEVAQPYGSDGCLKTEWGFFLKQAAEKKETVTAAKLLEHYELFLAEDTTLVEHAIKPKPEPEVKIEEEDVLRTSKENIDASKEAVAGLGSPWEDFRLFKREASPTSATLMSCISP
jgi:hypothetical protein